MSELTAGQLLAGRFRLERRLGGGGAGEVWLADDAELKEPVALKILAASISADSRQLDALRAECRKTRALVHPNIVRVYDLHADGGLNFISMQYVAGGDLGRLRGAPFQEVVTAALMLCDALDYAHRQGLIHRDLKAANILLDKRGECLLTDFGVAASLASTASGSRGGGTLPFMSPQQVDGQPPAVADDIYGLGALLYELLSGTPPLHPDVTPERIRTEMPAPLDRDGTAQALPPALSRLVAAMLAKSPSARPAGVAAVRAVLEEIRTDNPAAVAADVIQPISRGSAPAGGAGQARGDLPPIAPATGKRQGLPAGVVIGGFVLLIGLALVVVFLLPSLVQERGPLVDRAPPEPPRPAGPAADPAATLAQRELADQVLGELLPLEDRLRARGVEQWGGPDWADVLALSETGDEAYRDRDFDTAAQSYRRAQALAQALEPRAEQVLADALAAAETALLDGDKARAVAQYELALAVDGGNATAVAGLARAQRLDEVLAAMARATERESAGDDAAAAEAYAAALAVDPEWGPAKAGLARSRGSVSQAQYERQMANGFSALSRENFSAARSAFESALRVRPGDGDARAALSQLAAEERLQRVLVLEREARELASAERWPEAASKYEAALAIDAGLISARQGLAQAQARARLDQDVEQAIGLRDRFYEPSITRQARAVLARVAEIPQRGPRLTARSSELARLLQVAANPVPVRFQSDNLTEVVIYKVGRLGTFADRVIELRPGRYVAVGSRDGYRDVRRDFSVAPDGSTPPVVVRCEEAI